MHPYGELPVGVVLVLDLLPDPLGLESGDRKESSGIKQGRKSQLTLPLPLPNR